MPRSARRGTAGACVVGSVIRLSVSGHDAYVRGPRRHAPAGRAGHRQIASDERMPQAGWGCQGETGREITLVERLDQAACHDFSAPAVSPWTSAFWMTMKMRTTGSVVRTPLAMMPPQFVWPKNVSSSDRLSWIV